MRQNIKKPEYEQKQFMLSPETQMVDVKNLLFELFSEIFHPHVTRLVKYAFQSKKKKRKKRKKKTSFAVLQRRNQVS